MSRLAIDLDGVCYDFLGYLTGLVAEEWGISREEVPRVTSWHFDGWDIDPSTLDGIIRRSITSGGLYWEGEPFPETVDTLYRLSERYEIVIVTHRNAFRGIEDECRRATEYWLNRWNFPYSDLILTGRKVGLGTDLLLDDAEHNIEASLAAGERAVLYERPYNIDAPYPRVRSWSEFEAYANEVL